MQFMSPLGLAGETGLIHFYKLINKLCLSGPHFLIKLDNAHFPYYINRIYCRKFGKCRKVERNHTSSHHMAEPYLLTFYIYTNSFFPKSF